MNLDPLHRTLLLEVANWANALDPDHDGESTPSLRLKKLAKEASSPFPLLVVAHSSSRHDRHGDLVCDDFFDTRQIDDMPSLVAWLAELKIEHDINHDINLGGRNDVELHPLPKRTRMVDGIVEDDLSSAEWDILASKVKVEVGRRVGKEKHAAEMKAQELRVRDAARIEKQERAQLTELQAKYGA